MFRVLWTVVMFFSLSQDLEEKKKKILLRLVLYEQKS